MKKITFFASLFLMLGLLSCSSDDSSDSTDDNLNNPSADKLIGSWRFDSYTEDGVAVELDACEMQNTVIFNEDGTAVLTNYWMNDLGECELDGIDNLLWENIGDSTYEVTSDGITEQQELVFSDGNNRFTISNGDEFGTWSESYVRF